jgi:16S rRNA (guanine527-N7)-methyltransferase
MAAIFDACGIRLSAAQTDQLWAYHSLLRERNPELNLTRVRNFANMVLKLYVDSVLPAGMIALPSPLLDLGTGPGMPGIPLKILRPELEILLAEGRARRVEFLNAAVERLGLAGLRVLGRRIDADFTEPVAGVITRAVEPIAETLARVHGCLAGGGRAIFMKGPHCDAEIESARARFEKSFVLDLDRPYAIPGTRHARRLVVFRRLDEPLYSRREKALKVHPAHAVSSRQNAIFKDLRKLLGGRGLRKSAQALVSGAKPIREILARHPDRCEAWVGRADESPPPAGAPGRLKWLQLAPELFDELDLFGTRAPLLLIARPEIRPWEPSEGLPPGLSLMIPFQDPENVGAAIRSAAAFGAAQVILLAESAHPYHPKALRACGSPVLEVALREGPALAAIPAEIPVLSLSAEGADIREAVFPPAFGLLAGLEGPGLPPGRRLRSLRIPIRPEVDSLNAAAAVSVAMYEWRRRGRRDA